MNPPAFLVPHSHTEHEIMFEARSCKDSTLWPPTPSYGVHRVLAPAPSPFFSVEPIFLTHSWFSSVPLWPWQAAGKVCHSVLRQAFLRGSFVWCKEKQWSKEGPVNTQPCPKPFVLTVMGTQVWWVTRPFPRYSFQPEIGYTDFSLPEGPRTEIPISCSPPADALTVSVKL